MHDFIHRKNLEHYRKLLSADALDEGDRKYEKKLLAAEEANDRRPSAPKHDD